jgi:hypothetical protein
MAARAGQALRSAWLGESHLIAGRIPDASRLAHQALNFAHAHQERGHETWAFRLLAEIAAKSATELAQFGTGAASGHVSVCSTSSRLI